MDQMKELKAEIVRVDTIVIVKFTQIDEEERETGTLIEDNSREFIKSIRSVRRPDIQADTLYAPGHAVDKDFSLAYRNYVNIETAKKAVEDIKALMEKYNKGVRDYNLTNGLISKNKSTFDIVSEVI